MTDNSPDEKQFILVTGLSGAGKTLALHLLEDLNYFCVDNLPAVLLPQFVEVCSMKKINKIAVGIDVRGGEFLSQVTSSLEVVIQHRYRLEILYLESADDILVRRFSETRRRHPLSPTGGILEGIHKERKVLFELRGSADKIIDTSAFSPHQLREELKQLYHLTRNGKPLEISILSFGYKYGLPLDADLVLDVRFLPNPFYREDLHDLSGNDAPVREYVLAQPQTREFLKLLFPFLNFTIPQYESEGKHHLTVAVGCTGGRHRSIVLANEMKKHLLEKNYRVRVSHRDVDR